MQKLGILATVNPTETSSTAHTDVVATFTDGSTSAAVLGPELIRVGTIKTLANLGLDMDVGVVLTESYTTRMNNNLLNRNVQKF